MLGYSTNPIKTPTGRNKERKPKMSHNRFRPLNENEIHMFYASGDLCMDGNPRLETEEHYLIGLHAGSLEVSYETIFSDYHTNHRTNPTPEFVVCLIRCYIVEHPIAFVWRGVSRCAKGDTFNRQRGEALAFLRAIRHSKPVEI